MQELQCDSRVLCESSWGPILYVTFGGHYPPGAAGNPIAVAMREYVSPVVAKHRPAAVMFDLNALDYVWGDALGGVVMPLLDRGFSLTNLTCIVATGRTAEALKPFFGPKRVWGFVGVKFFGNLDNGLTYLKNCLGEATG